jgi:hypothetical protein
MNTKLEVIISAATAAVIFIAVSLMGGCVTAEAGGKKIDPCKALLIASTSYQVANSGADLVCQLVPEKDRAKCLKYKAITSTGANTALTFAAGALQQCHQPTVVKPPSE